MVTGLVAQDTSILLPLPKAASAQQHHLEQHPKGSSCCRQADSRVLFFFLIYIPLSKEETLRDSLLQSKQLGSAASPVLQPLVQPQSLYLTYGI